jgi:hypothetical protein
MERVWTGRTNRDRVDSTSGAQGEVGVRRWRRGSGQPQDVWVTFNVITRPHGRRLNWCQQMRQLRCKGMRACGLRQRRLGILYVPGKVRQEHVANREAGRSRPRRAALGLADQRRAETTS